MRVAIVTCVKNEGAFLLEWIAHHRAIGVTDFLVFSNDCSDGTAEMLDRLQAMGVLAHERNPGPWETSPQWDALNRAHRHAVVKAAEWVLVCDVDEFVNIHAGAGRIEDLLAALPEADAIALTWRLFGNAGVLRYQDRPVTEQFVRAAPEGMLWPWRASMFKTLLRNDGSYRKLGVHRPRGLKPDRADALRWIDGAGRPLPDSYRRQGLFTPLNRPAWGLVQLNHYALGAMESYVLKCDRGRANRDVGGFDMSYWVERNFCEVEDRSILRLSAVREAESARLMADAELAALHGAAVAWRHARLRALMAQEEQRGLFGRLMLTPPSRPLPRALALELIGHARRAQVAEAAADTRSES